MKKLTELGWGSPLHDITLFVLGESVDYRKVRMYLKSKKCEGWIRLTPPKNGLL